MIRGGYYTDRLAAERLRRCYALAPPRVRQYLEAEIAHVSSRIRPGALVLDVGCGYGRAIPAWAERTGRSGLVIGIDTSAESLGLARRALKACPNVCLIRMEAQSLGFIDEAFDVTACIQNGVSAFHVDERHLLEECLRVTRPGGTVLISSYAEKFWPTRLEWFRLQAREGLIGDIDEESTGRGVIACQDGFRATTVSVARFRELAGGLKADVTIEEVDGSSLFCDLVKRHPPGRSLLHPNRRRRID
jgi:SAM-dependent methyltransferase